MSPLDGLPSFKLAPELSGLQLLEQPVEHGGPGFDVTDRFILSEELELAGAPALSPFGLHMVGPLLIQFGNESQKKRFLPEILSGEEVWCQGYSEPNAGSDLASLRTRADDDGAGHFVVNGQKTWTTYAQYADWIFCLVRTDSRGHHAAMLTLSAVEGERLAGDGAAAVELALDVGAAGACAEGVGIVRTVLAMTTEYLRTREQFGVKIGTFKALQHRAVDMFVESELCRSMAILAAIKVDDPDVVERQSAVSAAKVQLATGGRLVTQEAIQLHGGIGITDEHDVGLYCKRMQVLSSVYGDEEHHLQRFAALPSFTAGI